jgi:hypothetical protein
MNFIVHNCLSFNGNARIRHAATTRCGASNNLRDRAGSPLDHWMGKLTSAVIGCFAVAPITSTEGSTAPEIQDGTRSDGVSFVRSPAAIAAWLRIDNTITCGPANTWKHRRSAIVAKLPVAKCPVCTLPYSFTGRRRKLQKRRWTGSDLGLREELISRLMPARST